MDNEAIDRYQIKEKIGAGGMGTVYRAWDRELERNVALKWLPAYFSKDDTFTERFKREIRVIAHLEHQHIVPIYDVGESDGRPFIIMRLLEGGTLNDRIKRGDFLLADLVKAVEQIAGALAAAHERQIVHRDIKPGNILFDSHGSAFLSDFGIAKVLDSGTQLTGSGFIGTPAYMSPEQFTGQGIDGRSDQYSLAVVSYEALAGALPFEGNTAQMMYKHINVSPPDIDLDQHPIPSGLNPILQKSLAKDPTHRYARITDFATAMAIAMRMEPATSSVVLPVIVGKPATGASMPPTAPTAVDTPPETRQDTVSQEYQAGLEALALGQWAAALAAFDRVLEAAPGYGNVTEFRRQAQSALAEAEATTLETPAAAGTATNLERTVLEPSEPPPASPTAARSAAPEAVPAMPPPERERAVPLWAMALVALLLIIGAGYLFSQFFGNGGDREPPAADGGAGPAVAAAIVATETPPASETTPPQATATALPVASATNVTAGSEGAGGEGTSGEEAVSSGVEGGSSEAESDAGGAAAPQPIVDGTQAAAETPAAEATSTTGPPTAEPTEPPPAQPSVRVIVSSANLRRGPGTIYPVAGAIFGDEEALVLATNSDGTWYNVELADGSRAWLAASVTEPLDAVAVNSVPVAATIPAAPTLTPVPPTATPMPTLPPPPPPPPPSGGGDGGGDDGGGDGGGGGGGGDDEPQPPPRYTAEPP